MEDRQGEGGLGDEDVARHRLERRTGGIRPALEVARDHDALAAIGQHCLRRAQDMTGRRQADIDLSQADGLAVGQRLLRRPGHVLEARAHDGQRLRRGQRRAMAGSGVVAMSMRDQCTIHRHGRVDIEVARFAIKPAGRRIEPGPRIQRGGV